MSKSNCCVHYYTHWRSARNQEKWNSQRAISRYKRPQLGVVNSSQSYSTLSKHARKECVTRRDKEILKMLRVLSINGAPGFLQHSGTSRFHKSPFLCQFDHYEPTIQAQFFSRNEGLAIDTLVKPIGHQQPQLWATLHLPFLLSLSPWIAKIKTETVALSGRPTKAASAPGLPPITPQESMWQPKPPECHVVGEYLPHPLICKNWTRKIEHCLSLIHSGAWASS
jgi:hypothetical protein